MGSRKATKMLNFLRGRINGKDEATREEAQGFIDAYDSLGDPERKAAFLKDFETNGGGKGKDGGSSSRSSSPSSTASSTDGQP